MPSIKSLKSQDFIDLQDKLYQILDIVSKNESILVEASYPLRDIKLIIDNIGQTNIGVIARESTSRQRKGRRQDVILNYQEKLRMALDVNDPSYTCCSRCKEPITTGKLSEHQDTAKCHHNYNRILAGRHMRRAHGTLIKMAIPVIGDLIRMIRNHKTLDNSMPLYYFKYGERVHMYRIKAVVSCRGNNKTFYTEYYRSNDDLESIGWNSIKKEIDKMEGGKMISKTQEGREFMFATGYNVGMRTDVYLPTFNYSLE